MDEPLTHSEKCGSFEAGKPFLLGIFDGMGGEEHGEIASQLSACCARDMYADISKHPLKTMLSFDGEEFLREIIRKANRAVCEYAEKNKIRSMGTTAAMLLFERKCIHVCNIGDSRIYRIAGGTIEQISKDHVSVKIQGRKPALSQCIGIPEDEMLLQPYCTRVQYKAGDKYLICSDGITDMLENDVICDIISKNNAEKAAKLLLQAALDAGGIDNTTAIVIEITA